MKRIRIIVRDGKVEGKNDGNPCVICYTSCDMGWIYERFRMYLYGTEDRTYDHSQVFFGICLGTMPIFHKLLRFSTFHICRIWLHLQRICIFRNGRSFSIYDHREATCCKYCCTQEREIHRQLVASRKLPHRDMAEADYKWLDIFCISPYDTPHHIHVFRNLAIYCMKVNMDGFK